MHYQIVFHNTVLGPMTENQILSYEIDENTQVSKDNGPWQPLYAFPELMSKLAQKRSMLNPQNSDVVSKKTLCGIMAIIFGGFGVQYYIIGKIGGGLVTLLLTMVTCGLWSILTLVQGILMLTMSDEEFYRKYVASHSFMPLF